MRKLRNSLLALACVATLFSCTREEILEAPKVSLTFSVAKEPSDSKAVLNGNAVVFEAGDQIGVWDGSSLNCFETAAGGAHASFSGTAASASEYILISPFNTNYSVNGSVVTYSIPEIQVATPGSADPNALVSMAKVSGTSDQAVLYNCVGLIKLEVPDGLTVKEIYVGGGVDSSVGICGLFTFNTNDQTVNYVDEGSMCAVITLVPPAGQSEIAPGTYYVAVRPWTYSQGLTVAYVNADNQLCKRTTTKTAAVARNHILPVGALDSNYAPQTGAAVLRYAGDAPQFTGLIKKLAGGSGSATADDNTIKRIVFKAHTLYPQTYKQDGNVVSNGPASSIQIHTWIEGDTAYVCTEAPTITLHSASGNLMRNFVALEEVVFNSVAAQPGTSLEYAFRNDAALKTVDFGDCDFSNVANMQFMLDNCSNLEVARFGKTATTSLQMCKAVFRGCTWMKELNLGPNFTITHLADKSQCNNMFYETALSSNGAAGDDVSKKCRLYMSQEEFEAARYDRGGVCANSALVPARFWLNPGDSVDPVDPDPTPSTGPKFSIFGDSISTYAGYIQGYTTYYPYGTLNDVNMTYWMKLIAKFDGAALEKNISYSGSCVSYAEETYETTSATGRSYQLSARKTRCFLTRYAESGIGNPDVLILYGGTNDRVFCKGNVPRPGDHFVENGQYFYSEDGGKGQYSPASGEVEALCATASADLDLDYFMPAYVELLRRIFNDHADVKIVCLVGDGMTDAQDEWIKGVTEYFANHGYQNRIKTVSFHNEGNYDGKHYDPKISKVSGVHPDDAGMTYMADFIYNEIKDWI
ncbi:MAG: hypothetical protein J6S97_08875 [Bacteroidales bacterium]|nr:hypothetical protein [Bacteroidales bacterium]